MKNCVIKQDESFKSTSFPFSCGEKGLGKVEAGQPEGGGRRLGAQPGRQGCHAASQILWISNS